MKRSVSLLLTAVFLFGLITAPFASFAVTGQTSEEMTEIYPGVTSTHYTTGSGTVYGLQDMTVVEFDPKQSDLSVHVTTGYSSLNSLSTVSNTVKRWSSSNPDKIPIVGINGDWFTVSYDNYSTATSKKQLYIPLGFNMHAGEIITTQQTAVETENSGYAPSFGIASDGTPLIGCIDTTVTMQYGSNVINIDGINRLPSDNALILYTDKGPASNYCLDDAYELYVDFTYDYTVKNGMGAIGTVSAISEPGEARLSMQSNRMIITARGSRKSDVSRIPVGASLRFSVSISDRYGRTEQWKTVTDCVGGHHEFARDGQYFNIGDSTHYPANVIGITSEGKVKIICNDGRQSGYSVGVSINKMATLAMELGIISGIYMDGGGSTTMVQTDRLNGMKLVNRPCNSNNAERTVSNALILAADRIAPTTHLTFDDYRYYQFVKASNNSTDVITDAGLTLRATNTIDPFLELSNFDFSANEYKYVVITARTSYVGSGTNRIGLFLAAGDLTYSSESCKAGLDLPETGSYERVLVDLTSLSLWKGKVNSVRIDYYDDTSSVPVGKGIDVREIQFFKTKNEAARLFKLPGDVDGNGAVTMLDISALKYYIATGGPVNTLNSDVNDDGVINLLDISALKVLIAG
ncbi:MAG: phosphodiester glycosidase family protein [Clostridia bacterium]|nr:phosphodiester glycosidase family protein [Clostridia bacterium]